MRAALFGVLAISAVSASSAFAQSRAQLREGPTGSVGFGLGSGAVTCADLCGGERQRAPSGYLRFGAAVTPHLVLAGELNAWSRKRTESFINSFVDPETNQLITKDGRVAARSTVMTLNAVAQWYPQSSGGFFVLGGLGIGRFDARAESKTIPLLYSAHTTALGYEVGAGYDIPLRTGLSLTPYATYFAAAPGEISGDSERVGANALQVGVGLTFY
jgi:hypothetical protein